MPRAQRVPARRVHAVAPLPGGSLRRRLTARVVWPVSSPPIQHGAVLIGDDGRIAAVGPASAVPAAPGVADSDLGDVALLPGLVNAHTHLELTGFRGRINEQAFVDWILRVRRSKEATESRVFLDWAREGVREAWRYGTTTVADTGDSGAAAKALTQLGGRGVAYQEVFGPHPDQADTALGGLEAAVDRLVAESSSNVAIGISPHAPYTVSSELYHRAATLARTRGLPLAGHLAESPAEVRLIRDGGGEFALRWKERGIPMPEPAPSPIVYADRTGLLGPDFLAIHAVHAGPEDIDLLAERGAAVAVCPRSNAAHAHGDPPLRSLLAAGIRVGLGTDSVASVPDLDLFADARAARQLASLSPEDAIALITLGGAAAIGMADAVGSLEARKWGDICAVAIKPTATDSDGLGESILEGHVVLTLLAGKEVYRAG